MSKLDKILHREMTRKQFVATIALAFVSVFGFSSIVGILSGDNQKKSPPAGYGGRTYGN